MFGRWVGREGGEGGGRRGTKITHEAVKGHMSVSCCRQCSIRSYYQKKKSREKEKHMKPYKDIWVCSVVASVLYAAHINKKSMNPSKDKWVCPVVVSVLYAASVQKKKYYTGSHKRTNEYVLLSAPIGMSHVTCVCVSCRREIGGKCVSHLQVMSCRNGSVCGSHVM